MINSEPSESSESGAKPDGRRLILICSVRSTIIGLPVDGLLGVTRIAAGAVLPDTPPFISGLHSLRNGLFVGIDIGVILGRPSISFDFRTRALLAEEEGVKSVLLVDEIQSMVPLELINSVKKSRDTNSNQLHFATCIWKDNTIEVFNAGEIIKFGIAHSFDIVGAD